MRLSTIKKRINKALDLLQSETPNLLDLDCSEWAIAHRIAVYLERRLQNWNVDCEYNRVGSGRFPKYCYNEDNISAICRPDIVIHRRTDVSLDGNLLVIEVKKKNEDLDGRKLKDFTSAPRDDKKYQYIYGLSLSFTPVIQLIWYQNGDVITPT